MVQLKPTIELLFTWNLNWIICDGDITEWELKILKTHFSHAVS